MKNGLSCDDVLLVPQHSTIISRSEIDIGNNIGDAKLRIPVIASPMDTITGPAMLKALDEVGCIGILHRYNTPADQASTALSVLEARPNCNMGLAVGVTGDYMMRIKLAAKMGIKLICVDIAHGHHVLMEAALKGIRDAYGDSFHIMAGNVATLQGFNDLADWGADSVRVGIGGGSICSTRIQTGHGVSTLQSVMDCSQTDRDAKLIADGGIKNSGDIVKILAAGADFAMVGSLLAGTTETPGGIIYDKERNTFKAYRGMASKEAQIEWRGSTSSIEGISSMVPHKGPVAMVIEGIETGIRSGFSYSGSRNIGELHAKAKFIGQTPSGAIESSTHIMRRGGV
jgi:IMP dehydrogenase